MREISKEELSTILVNHLHWSREDINDWENMRAVLSDANLSYVDLTGANLRGAVLSDANLSHVDLTGANLRGASLTGAKLRGASLSNANLRYADLSYADLLDADLSNADLSCATLNYANLRGAKNVPFIPLACPSNGSFIGYKKASGFIVELEILADARRSSATSHKCRCDKARVVSIQNLDGTVSLMSEVQSSYDNRFVYRVGEIVEEPNFCTDRFNECAPGIHFFINREEAVNY